jgi:hypothetical protein
MSSKLMSISLGSDKLRSSPLVQKGEEEKRKKEEKIVLIPACRDVGHRSLGAYSQPAC